MTRYARPDEFDSLMADWFDRDAQVRPPEALLATTLERTARKRPLPAWRLPERWLPLATLAIRRPAVPRGAYVLLLIALLVAFAAALLLVVGTHKLPPLIGPAANGRIAYVAGGQLYAANPDGSNVVQLTTGAAFKGAPAFSNDGTKIVYLTSNTTTAAEQFLFNDLTVADVDGTHARVLMTNTRAMSNPAWSPDGRFIAISTAAEGEADHLNIVAADGSGVTDLGDFGAGAWAPTWAPDSRRLAMIVGTAPFTQRIYLVDRDGKNAQPISHGSYKEIGEDVGAAMWSPDGTLLLFGGGDLAGFYQQFIVGLDGAPERAVESKDGGDDGVWSPDGSRIAYLRPGTGSGPSVVIADRTGKELRVMDGQYSWHMPVWSPDGTRIAIADDRPGTFNLAGNPVTVILDAIGSAAPVTIPGVVGSDPTGGLIPSSSATWQRLALP